MTILTIIIPTYDNVLGFSKSIDKLRQQKEYNKSDVSLIISDDSNNENIYKYYKSVESSFDNIAYFRGPQLGAVMNWNISMERSSSDYLMFIHHDEYILSEFFLNKILKILVAKDIDLLVLPLVKEKKAKFFKHYPIRLKSIFIRFPSLLFSCNPFGPPSVLILRSNISEKFDSNLSWFVDVEWYFRILIKRPKVKVLNDMDYKIVSDLNFDDSITTNLDLTIVQPKEENYIIMKHALSSYKFSFVFKILRLPVKFLKLFNV